MTQTTQTTLLPSNATSGGCLNSTNSYDLRLALSTPSQVLCLLGLAGNGFVIWFLCFGVKRNPFTVYILNLAVIDFFLLLLISSNLLYIIIKCVGLDTPFEIEIFFWIATIFGINLSLYLLTAISMERCMSVIYPLWYKCHRPKNLSAIMCLILWAAAILFTTVEILPCTGTLCTGINIFLLSWTFGVITPLMIVSSLLLAICVQRTSQRRQPMRLYRAIVINVLVFLITTVPTRLVYVFYYFQVIKLKPLQLFSLFYAHIFLAAVNSTANPFIYVLVGKAGKIKSTGFLKEALLRIFKIDHDMSSSDGISTPRVARTKESIISKNENLKMIH